MQWKRWLILGVVLVGSFGAQAQPSQARKQVEASMNVAGNLIVSPSGEVTAISLEDEAILPAGVRDLVKNTVGSWRFDPLREDGSPLPMQLPMNLLLVARKNDDGSYRVRIRSAHFGGQAQGAETVTAQEMTPPRYPETAARLGVAGTVYLLLKVGRNGSVEDLVAEQVNLTVLGSGSRMQRWREQLADAVITRARSWRFIPPSAGSEVDAPFWVMRVPVTFAIERDVAAHGKRGQWQAYVPGPRQVPAWSEQEGAPVSDSPDALPGSGLFLAKGAGARLLTPLQDG